MYSQGENLILMLEFVDYLELLIRNNMWARSPQMRETA